MSPDIKEEMNTFRTKNSLEVDGLTIIKLEIDVENVSNVQKIPYQCPSTCSTDVQKSPDCSSNAVDDATAKKSKKFGILMGQKIPCPICNKDILPYSFQRHLGTHYGDRYQCPRCPKTFSQAGYTRIHIVSSHHEEKLNVDKIEIKLVPPRPGDVTVERDNHMPDYKRCPICLKHVGLSRFKKHLDKHKGVGYQCPRCSKTFSNARYTRNHLVISHDIDRVVANKVKIKQLRRSRSTVGYTHCPICNKDITPSKFQKHLDKHYGVRYQCPRCRNTFCDIGNTRRHLEYYHGETVEIGQPVSPVWFQFWTRPETKQEPVASSADDGIVIKIEKDE